VTFKTKNDQDLIKIIFHDRTPEKYRLKSRKTGFTRQNLIFFWFQNYLVIPMTPQASRAPAFPVVCSIRDRPDRGRRCRHESPENRNQVSLNIFNLKL
jgi:hypothetical protein